MKKTLFVTLLGISALATHAVNYRDNDLIGGSDKNINKNDPPVNGVFDLVTAGVAPDAGGFLPGSTVNKAVATFDLEANGNFVMTFDISLDGFFFASGSTPANGGVIINGDGTIDGVGANAANELSILAALSDGISNYKVTRTDSNQGTLRFNSADLQVLGDNVIPPEGTLPDGGATMVLLGGGISALALLRRKLS